ncbi:hypothetical protein FACS1894200_03510 [Spirochaetia bacterium]|nr:hypothetical protein FACS1894200_03510 [Spirochaetia bacterium]
MTAIKQEVHTLIDCLTERNLYALKPLLTALQDNEPLIIETDLTDEEHELIEEGMKETFTSWKQVRRVKL